ncbi:VWA domain-containing protein [Streptomyces sp. NPDC002795]|uniref:vWA domain-containing protein n=1 Tax=Streptomyces sp. NPDC002795 TaxID=3364665 RepID=UPI00367580DB
MHTPAPRRISRLLIAPVTALLLIPLGPVPTAAAADQDEAPRIETILDVSGSMKASDVGGGTRMDAAKEAMYTLIDSTPSGVDMGVRLYGSEYPGANKSTGCKDTELISPVAALDTEAKASVKKKVAATKPTGFTPIGHSLKQAARDLGSEGKRRIILLSDGEDTCAPPEPCEVAKELEDAGVDLVVDTLGFKVNGKAVQQLKCIADATNGTYREAEDATELGAALQGLLRQGIKGYEATGTPVQGGASCESAPVIKPGQYVDTLAGGQNRYYRMTAQPGQAVRFGATWLSNDSSTGIGTWIKTHVNDQLGHVNAPITSSFSGAGGGAVISSGEQSDRITFENLTKARPAPRLCAEIVPPAGADENNQVEVIFNLVGNPLTQADVKKLKKDPEALAEPNDAEVIAGGSAEAPVKPSDATPGSANEKQERAEPAGASSGLTSPLWLGCTLAVALLVGAVTGLLIKRNRRA